MATNDRQRTKLTVRRAAAALPDPAGDAPGPTASSRGLA